MKATTPEAARMLGIEPRTLRKYLRNHTEEWPGVGTGGRYWFSQGDINKLAREMGIDMTRKYHDKPGFSISEVVRSKHDDALRAKILAERAARARRLEEQMRKAGVWGTQSRRPGLIGQRTGNFV